MKLTLESGECTRLPPWFAQELPEERALTLGHLLNEFGVRTVCKEARCPNLSGCFKHKELTFLILGDTCTRRCLFCNVGTPLKTKLSCTPDKARFPLISEFSVEARNISQLVELLDLRYVVITSVTRDDLADGGAAGFMQTIECIRATGNRLIELLIPDFNNNLESVKRIAHTPVVVIGHNIETVERLYPILRQGAHYNRSLGVLKKLKEFQPSLLTKSSLMVGFGETEAEVLRTLKDLRQSDCDIVVVGQYLAPSKNHFPVKEFVGLEQFRRYGDMALRLGFKAVVSEPLGRSSFRAKEAYALALKEWGKGQSYEI